MFTHVYGYVSATYVLSLLQSNNTYFIYEGIPISINGLKFKLFKYKGVNCLNCKAEGFVFIIFKNKRKFYLNLYTTEGILMTKDHIIPKSRGGVTKLRNLQPLCIKCNMKKSNNL